MMKKIILFTIIVLSGLMLSAQSVLKTNLEIQKSAPALYLNGTGATINLYNGDVTLTQSSNLLTLAGGDFALGSNNITMTGSLGATGGRILKGWMTDLEITNLPTINGGLFKTALSLTASDVGLGNVTNESKATMFTSPTFTGVVGFPSPFTLGGVSVTANGTELNVLDNIPGTLTSTELGFSDGVTSSIQGQLNSKLALVDTSAMLGPYALTSEVGSGFMVYPGSGIPISTGSSWTTSITNNSVNWDSAYVARLRWNGGSTGLVAATGRTSLGGTTIGQSMFTLANPSAITFPRFNADNSVSALTASSFKTALSLAAADVGLGNVTNESKATMFTSPTFTGHPTIEGVTSTGATGTGNMVFSISPTLTGTVTIPTPFTLGATSVTANGAELNVLDNIPVTLTSTELGFSDGVTSSIQTQLNSKVFIADSTGRAPGNYMPRTSTENLVNDSIEARIAAGTVGVALADSNIYNGGYTTRTYVESLLGSGSGLSAQRLPFIIGTTTGAPTTEDSTIVHSAFAGKHIDLYRDGAKQYQNFTATNTVEGFRLSNDTIYVYPLWQDNEEVLVDIIEPILWSYLSLEGKESTLLDSLRGYWKFDESSGSTVTDAVGIQNGTRTAGVDVGVAGKLGYSNEFDAAGDAVRIPYNANMVPKGVDFSIAMWFKFDSLASLTGREQYLFQQFTNGDPNTGHHMYVNDDDDKIVCYSRNSSGTIYSVTSTSALSDSTWYHVVFVNAGNGQTLKLYINGADVSAAAGTFTGTLVDSQGSLYFGNIYTGASNYLGGVVDSPGIWGRALTAGEVTTLYNSGNGKAYPFN